MDYLAYISAARSSIGQNRPRTPRKSILISPKDPIVTFSQSSPLLLFGNSLSAPKHTRLSIQGSTLPSSLRPSFSRRRLINKLSSWPLHWCRSSVDPRPRISRGSPQLRDCSDPVRMGHFSLVENMAKDPRICWNCGARHLPPRKVIDWQSRGYRLND